VSPPRLGAGRPVGFAVIGLGLMGRVHAAEIRRSSRATLTTVFDTDAAAMDRVSSGLSVPASPTVESALERNDVEAVVLATPPSTHADLVALAASAGRHVLCEKPLAATAAEGVVAVEAARRAGVELRVGFHRRFDRDFAALKDRIDRGELGELRMFVCTMRDPEPPPDAVVRSGEDRLIRDGLCHDIDCGRWLMGEVAYVAAQGRSEPGSVFEELGEPDTVVVTLGFVTGAIGVVDATVRAGYGFDSRVEVLGSTAAVRIHRPGLGSAETLSPGRAVLQQPRSFLDRYREAYGPEIEAFVDAVRNGEGRGADGEDALTTLRVCEAAERSLRQDRTILIRSGAYGMLC
jgi:predicted dehydrogenase